MTRQEIIDAAAFIAERNGVTPLPAGKMMGIDFDTLWGEWADYANPKIARISGVVSSDAQAWYPLPGFRSEIYVSVGGYVATPVPESLAYYNAENEGYTTGESGYIIRDGAMRFTIADTDSEQAIVSGAAWTVVYYCNNETVPDGAEPYIPDKLHMMLADELAYRWRDKYGGRPLGQSEFITRNKNKSNFLSEVNRTTQKDTPIQPNWFMQI